MNMREGSHIPEDDMIQYALGTFKDVQLSQFTAHVSLCNECRAELGRIQVELASFAAIQPTSELPAGARERFLQRLATDTAPDSKLVQLRNKSRLYLWSKSIKHQLESPLWLRVVTGALAAAVLFLGYDDLSHIHQIRQMQPEMARFERQAAALTELQDFLRGTDTQQISPNLPACTPVSAGGTDLGCTYAGSGTVVPATVIQSRPRATD